MNTYKELIVWQKSFDLSLQVYRATSTFPKDELYGLTSQIRRSAVSIPSNIAEGYSRRRKAEFLQFLHVAYGSAAELETQLLLSKELNYLNLEDFSRINSLLNEVLKMLGSLIVKVKT
ncbi:MAG: four helix bundle protein [Patescibacteria group bacterium]|nr:four helix bundle protein [Patescibacteria group bacterium]MCL5431932.1 four helix bundle protein [Patescibacteria group bacterium]